MKTFRLEILSPDRAFYRGDSVSLIIPISDGMMGIMAGHTPLTAAIVDGAVIFEKPDGERVVMPKPRKKMKEKRSAPFWMR